METKPYFSGSQLKWLAIFAMLLDHTAKIISFQPSTMALVPYAAEPNTLLTYTQIIFPLFIMIGRLAFPIFCFLLVEGFIHTSNPKKYLLRLTIFALIAEVPYDLAFSHQFIDLKSQNVFFTLLIGLIVIIGLKKIQVHSLKSGLLATIVIGTGIFCAEWLQTDYGGWIGVLLIVSFYLLRKEGLIKCIAGALILLQNSLFGVLAFVPIYFYNGQRGKQWKYFFYWFYPVHLLVLYGIQEYLVLPYLN
ncbi:TraX family protein [Enterococcus crotali]